MNKYEVIAAGTFLNEWPEDISYQTFIERLQTDDFGIDEHEIVPVAFIENHPGAFIAESIDDLKSVLANSFKEQI